MSQLFPGGGRVTVTCSWLQSTAPFHSKSCVVTFVDSICKQLLYLEEGVKWLKKKKNESTPLQMRKMAVNSLAQESVAQQELLLGFMTLSFVLILLP